VLAVVIEAVLRIGKRALKNAAMYVIACAAFIGIFFLAIPFPIIVATAAAIGVIGNRLSPANFTLGSGHEPVPETEDGSPSVDAALEGGTLDHTKPSAGRSARVLAICGTLWFGPLIVLYAVLGPSNVYIQEGLFFSKMAVATFGGAYAVLAYVAQQAVDNYGWLTPSEMLDGLGMAETTPGPLIMVVQFVGFMGAYRNPGMLDPMTAGIFGAMLTTWVTFVPCFLWIFLGAPYIEALRGNRALTAGLSAVTAAVVGVVLNLAVWFALHVVFGEVQEDALGPIRLFVPVWHTVEWAVLAIAVGALVAMLRFKAGMIPTLFVSGVLGVIYFYTAT